MTTPPAGPPSTAALLQTAIGHHRAGRLQAAEQLYRQILAREPDHADSLDFLGVVAHQQGRDDEAIPLIEAAIRRNPKRALYLSDLASVQQRQGDLAAAIVNFRRAIALEPGFVHAHFNLGNALVAQGEREAALASIAEPPRSTPTMPFTLGVRQLLNHLPLLRRCDSIRKVALRYVMRFWRPWQLG